MARSKGVGGTRRRPLLYHRRFKELPEWTPERIRQLRQHMGMTQAELATTIEVRQATISEWESGLYRPRRMMRLVLTILADQSRFPL